MIDFGLGNPEVLAHFERALAIIDGPIAELAARVSEHSQLDPTSELARLDHSLPAGPLNIITALTSAVAAATGSLQQISTLIDRAVPSSPIVFQTLLRTALVGAARTIYPLLPSDPDTRSKRSAAILAQDAKSGIKGLEHYTVFTGLAGVRAPQDLLVGLRNQRKDLQAQQPASTDTGVVEAMTQAISEALQLAGVEDAQGTAILRDHTHWLWNTYSGLAHGYSWPSALWSLSGDPRIPGDYPMDLSYTATCTHIALIAALTRARAGTSGTTEAVDLQAFS